MSEQTNHPSQSRPIIVLPQAQRELLPILCSSVLPKGLWLNWLGEPSGTPQVLGSTPRGSEFQVEVKKIPSLCLPSRMSRPVVTVRPSLGAVAVVAGPGYGAGLG